jgi:hypothetical protein
VCRKLDKSGPRNVQAVLKSCWKIAERKCDRNALIIFT